jgi:hypothetical protein
MFVTCNIAFWVSYLPARPCSQTSFWCTTVWYFTQTTGWPRTEMCTCFHVHRTAIPTTVIDIPIVNNLIISNCLNKLKILCVLQVIRFPIRVVHLRIHWMNSDKLSYWGSNWTWSGKLNFDLYLSYVIYMELNFISRTKRRYITQNINLIKRILAQRSYIVTANVLNLPGKCWQVPLNKTRLLPVTSLPNHCSATAISSDAMGYIMNYFENI